MQVQIDAARVEDFDRILRGEALPSPLQDLHQCTARLPIVAPELEVVVQQRG